MKDYRGWKIAYGRWPEPKYVAVHPDYDASYEGPEDGWVDNGLKASSEDHSDLLAQIDDIEADRE